jgi:hypothetical protein
METREHLSITSGLVLPLGQSIVTGLMTGAVAWVISNWAGWEPKLVIAGAAGAVVMLADWISLIRAWRRRVDTLAGVPEPATPPAPGSTLLEMSIGADRHTLRYADLPVDLERLQVLAAGVLDGTTLSEANWTPELFSRHEFSKLKAAMVRRGLAAHRSARDPARGIVLTRPGEAAFRWLASMYDDDPPYPTNLVSSE